MLLLSFVYNIFTGYMRDNLSNNIEIQLYLSKVPIKLIYNNIQVKVVPYTSGKI
jgi:hypothetical protein